MKVRFKLETTVPLQAVVERDVPEGTDLRAYADALYYDLVGSDPDKFQLTQKGWDRSFTTVEDAATGEELLQYLEGDPKEE